MMRQVVAWVGLSLLVLGTVNPHAGAQPSFEEVIDRLKSANPTLQTFVVDQEIEIRVLAIFRWRIRTTVYAARPASYKVVVHNLPPLLSRLGTVFSSISSPEEVLSLYRAESIRMDGDRLVVEMARVHRVVNPPGVRLVVDPRVWLIEEIYGRYEWGEVRARYRYGAVGGYALPVNARVSVPRFALSAFLLYTNYRLNVPIPPGTFAEAAGGR